MAQPDWVVALMPPGYANRLAEIQRLTAELRAMDRFASLLLETGPSLEATTREAFAAMRFEVETAAGGHISVKLDQRRRLLVHAAETAGTLAKKDPALERAFQLITQVAGKDDRVVILAAGDTSAPPADRPTPVTPEALELLERLGVNVVATPTLFALWSVSLQDQGRARTYLERLHGQNGGLAPTPTSRA